jgi:hypothetical protein
MTLRFHRSQAPGRFFGTARIEPCLSSAAYFLVFLLFPYGLSVVSRSISEALPDDAFDGPPLSCPNFLCSAELRESPL